MKTGTKAAKAYYNINQKLILAKKYYKNNILHISKHPKHIESKPEKQAITHLKKNFGTNLLLKKL
jgi:hypothetical protein